jgi:hypothetical protein
VLCGAAVAGNLLISVRTWGPSLNAAELVQQALRGLGRGGGHANRAGGRVALGPGQTRVPPALAEEIRKRWMVVCGVGGERPRRLVPERGP